MRDVMYDMEVTLEELCRGGSKKIRIWGESGGRGGRVAKDIEIELQSTMHTVGISCSAAAMFGDVARPAGGGEALQKHPVVWPCLV